MPSAIGPGARKRRTADQWWTPVLVEVVMPRRSRRAGLSSRRANPLILVSRVARPSEIWGNHPTRPALASRDRASQGSPTTRRLDMRTTANRSRAGIALLALLVVGCGGGSDGATSTTDAPTTVATADLTDYLLQANEVPGLTPVSSPETDSGPPFNPLPEDGAERLERTRYLRRPTSPPRASASAASAACCCSRPRPARGTGWPTRRATRRSGLSCPARRSSGFRLPTSRAPTGRRDRPPRQRDRPGLLDPGPLHDDHRHRGRGAACRTSVGRRPGDLRAHRRHLSRLMPARPRRRCRPRPCGAPG